MVVNNLSQVKDKFIEIFGDDVRIVHDGYHSSWKCNFITFFLTHNGSPKKMFDILTKIKQCEDELKDVEKYTFHKGLMGTNINHTKEISQIMYVDKKFDSKVKFDKSIL